MTGDCDLLYMFCLRKLRTLCEVNVRSPYQDVLVCTLRRRPVIVKALECNRISFFVVSMWNHESAHKWWDLSDPLGLLLEISFLLPPLF